MDSYGGKGGPGAELDGQHDPAIAKKAHSPLAKVLIAASAVASLAFTVPTLYGYAADALSGPPYPVADPLDADLAAGVTPRLAEIEADLGEEPAISTIRLDSQDLAIYILAADDPEQRESYTWSHDGRDFVTNPQPAGYDTADTQFRPTDVDAEAVARVVADIADRHPDAPDTLLVPRWVEITADDARLGEPEPVIVVKAEDDDDHSDARWDVVFGPDGAHLRTEQTRE